MSRRPISTVKFANDRFNFCNRLNHRMKIAILNRDGGKLEKYYEHQWATNRFIPVTFCEPCVAEIVKNRLVNRNPQWEKAVKKVCFSVSVPLLGVIKQKKANSPKYNSTNFCSGNSGRPYIFQNPQR